MTDINVLAGSFFIILWRHLKDLQLYTFYTYIVRSIILFTFLISGQSFNSAI